MIFRNVKKIFIPEGEVKRIESGGVLLWKSGYTNLVPTSIDTDGSIFNGTGYKDGYRLSSSGELKVQNNTATTGFIRATKKDTCRLGGVKWFESAGYNYFTVYDANFNLLGTANYHNGSSGDASQGFDYVTGILADKTKLHAIETNGVTMFEITPKNDQDYAYIRISAYGAGADMIITVNEEIEL